MRFTALILALIWAASLVGGCGCSKAKQRKEPPEKTTPAIGGTTLELMPASREPGGWMPTSPPKRYVGHELYEPIDGAADAFFQFGFKEAAFGMYRRDRSLIQLEVYRMGSPDDACAMASQFDNVNAEYTTLSDEGRATIDAGRVHFAKGPYFVVAQHAMYGEPSAVRTGLVELAETVAAKIEVPYHTPAILGLLRDGIVAGSVRYFRTPTTQGNIWYITYDNVLGLRPETFGVVADYDAVTTEAGTKAGRNALFVITYPSPEDAARIFQEAGKLLAREPFQVVGASTRAGALMSVNQDGKLFLKLGCTAGVLYGAWNIEDEVRVDLLLAELAARLQRATHSGETP